MAHHLLVHCAWGGGWVWDDVVPRLEDRGHRVTVVDQLPSAGTDPGTLGDLRSDAARIRQVLAGIEEPVVLARALTDVAELTGVRS